MNLKSSLTRQPNFTRPLFVLAFPYITGVELGWELCEVYYVIYRESGTGFNSMLSGVLGHLRICDSRGWIPVVDMQRHTGTYSEDFPVLGTSNMWEYYFNPVSEVNLQEVYESENWIDSQGRYPHEVIGSLIYGTPWITEIFDKYISLREESMAALEHSRQEIGISREVLGVHFRGKEMRTAPNHPMPPSEQQIFRRIDEALANEGFERIYLVSEGVDYVQSFIHRYGSRISVLDVSRSGSTNVYLEYPRPMHRYLLGLEVLVETHLLSECGGLISGYSGVSEMAHVLSRGHYRFTDKVWNGRVKGGALGARYLWGFRSRVPRLLGGFKS